MRKRFDKFEKINKKLTNIQSIELKCIYFIFYFYLLMRNFREQ
jgi:hypothetical protein